MNRTIKQANVNRNHYDSRRASELDYGIRFGATQALMRVAELLSTGIETSVSRS